ncbi:MAG: hypothetical protein ACI9W5_000187, partial [Ulvibacter sp.]
QYQYQKFILISYFLKINNDNDSHYHILLLFSLVKNTIISYF